MSDKSPLFVSSLELIAHATELFAQKSPKKYKFVILHLANAVELILKDCMIDQGVSIYIPKSNKTLTIWECTDLLDSKGVKLPERPVIELLIDDRNTIQHRFGYPSAEAVYYYIEQVVSFFQRFLNQHYNIQLIEALKPHLSGDHLKLLGLVSDETNNLDVLNKIASVSIEASVVRAYSLIEQELTAFLAPYYSGTSATPITPNTIIWNNPYLTKLLNDLKLKGYLKKDMYLELQSLRRARNEAAHKPEGVSQAEMQRAFDIAKELLEGLQKAKVSGYAFTPEVEIENSGQ